MNNIPLGKMGEKVAINYLIAQGYKIEDANYFNLKGYKKGEVDIIAHDKNGELVFVEVKSRKGKKDSVVPEENITPLKIRKIQKIANHYLAKEKLFDRNWRIDSVAIIFDFGQRKFHLRHIKYIRA